LASRRKELWFAKMISQARTLRISDIQIGVPSEELTKDEPHCYMGFARNQTGFSAGHKPIANDPEGHPRCTVRGCLPKSEELPVRRERHRR
jgi:hypothetical protein